jgi:hypothetical protein
MRLFSKYQKDAFWLSIFFWWIPIFYVWLFSIPSWDRLILLRRSVYPAIKKFVIFCKTFSFFFWFCLFSLLVLYLLYRLLEYSLLVSYLFEDDDDWEDYLSLYGFNQWTFWLKPAEVEYMFRPVNYHFYDYFLEEEEEYPPWNEVVDDNLGWDLIGVAPWSIMDLAEEIEDDAEDELECYVLFHERRLVVYRSESFDLAAGYFPSQRYNNKIEHRSFLEHLPQAFFLDPYSSFFVYDKSCDGDLLWYSVDEYWPLGHFIDHFETVHKPGIDHEVNFDKEFKVFRWSNKII